MEEKTCGACRHYHSHYVKWGENDYREIDMGHCSQPHLRNRRKDAEGCHRWEPRDEEE